MINLFIQLSSDLSILFAPMASENYKREFYYVWIFFWVLGNIYFIFINENISETGELGISEFLSSDFLISPESKPLSYVNYAIKISGLMIFIISILHLLSLGFKVLNHPYNPYYRLRLKNYAIIQYTIMAWNVNLCPGILKWFIWVPLVFVTVQYKHYYGFHDFKRIFIVSIYCLGVQYYILENSDSSSIIKTTMLGLKFIVVPFIEHVFLIIMWFCLFIELDTLVDRKNILVSNYKYLKNNQDVVNVIPAKFSPIIKYFILGWTVYSVKIIEIYIHGFISDLVWVYFFSAYVILFTVSMEYRSNIGNESFIRLNNFISSGFSILVIDAVLRNCFNYNLFD